MPPPGGRARRRPTAKASGTEVEALRKEIRGLEMQQRGERRDVEQLKARQRRSARAEVGPRP